MPFINREQELKALNEKWRSNIAQFFIIYGKRRVGKTELIKQFIKDKPAIYFLADKRTTADQLRELGQIVGNYFKDGILIKGFRNSSLNEFYITWNNFTDNYPGALYSMIKVCNVSISTGGDFANLTDISKKIINYNSFVGSGVAVNNSCTDVNLSLNLRYNYWNSAA